MFFNSKSTDNSKDQILRVTMVSTTSQAWLITGANRGIGFEITKLAAKKGYVVFAGVRDPSKAITLNELAATNPNIHLIKLQSASEADARAAARAIEEVTGGLDVVIANAGIANNWQKITDVEIGAVWEHFNVNTVGAIVLFQAVYPLLLKRQTRKFITVSTNAASIGEFPNFPHTAYGLSKAALNHLTKSIHTEHSSEGFIAFPIHPGFVTTDMGLAAAEEFDTGFMVPLTPEQSGQAVFVKVNTATLSDSGRFWAHDGTELSW
jgi:NAD(P)-dependent dehydrogenase (short-subunit alcohol dehydrogenase family)